MKYGLAILAFFLSIAAFFMSWTSASSRDTGAQGGCFPGTYLVVEGSGTQSLWTLSQDGGFQVTSSAERAFGFSHIQGIWKKTGARDANARGLDFNFNKSSMNGGVPPSQITRLDIVMRFADRCEEMEGSFELRAFNPNDDPLDSNTPAIASDTFFGRRVPRSPTAQRLDKNWKSLSLREILCPSLLRAITGSYLAGGE